eukprot:g1536.t1
MSSSKLFLALAAFPALSKIAAAIEHQQRIGTKKEKGEADALPLRVQERAQGLRVGDIEDALLQQLQAKGRGVFPRSVSLAGVLDNDRSLIGAAATTPRLRLWAALDPENNAAHSYPPLARGDFLVAGSPSLWWESSVAGGPGSRPHLPHIEGGYVCLGRLDGARRSPVVEALTRIAAHKGGEEYDTDRSRGDHRFGFQGLRFQIQTFVPSWWYFRKAQYFQDEQGGALLVRERTKSAVAYYYLKDENPKASYKKYQETWLLPIAIRQKKITEEKSESVFGGFSDDTLTYMPRYKPSRDIRPIPLQEERLVQSLEQLALAAGMAAPGVSVAEWISNLQQKLQAEVFQQEPPGGSGAQDTRAWQFFEIAVGKRAREAQALAAFGKVEASRPAVVEAATRWHARKRLQDIASGRKEPAFGWLTTTKNQNVDNLKTSSRPQARGIYDKAAEVVEESGPVEDEPAPEGLLMHGFRTNQERLRAAELQSREEADDETVSLFFVPSENALPKSIADENGDLCENKVQTTTRMGGHDIGEEDPYLRYPADIDDSDYGWCSRAHTRILLPEDEAYKPFARHFPKNRILEARNEYVQDRNKNRVHTLYFQFTFRADFSVLKMRLVDFRRGGGAGDEAEEPFDLSSFPDSRRPPTGLESGRASVIWESETFRVPREEFSAEVAAVKQKLALFVPSAADEQRFDTQNLRPIPPGFH